MIAYIYGCYCDVHYWYVISLVDLIVIKLDIMSLFVNKYILNVYQTQDYI